MGELTISIVLGYCLNSRIAVWQYDQMCRWGGLLLSGNYRWAHRLVVYSTLRLVYVPFCGYLLFSHKKEGKVEPRFRLSKPIRVHLLAMLTNVSSMEMVRELQTYGLSISTPSHSIDADVANRVLEAHWAKQPA